MKTNIRTLMASFLVSAAAFIGSASAGDQWFVLSEKTLKAADPSTEITSSGDIWNKNIKQVKLSVEGADVKVTSLALHWDNRPDATMMDVGVIKGGGQTAPMNAPGIKSRLTSITIQYQILGKAKSAKLKVWGYD